MEHCVTWVMLNMTPVVLPTTRMILVFIGHIPYSKRVWPTLREQLQVTFKKLETDNHLFWSSGLLRLQISVVIYTAYVSLCITNLQNRSELQELGYIFYNSKCLNKATSAHNWSSFHLNEHTRGFHPRLRTTLTLDYTIFSECERIKGAMDCINYCGTLIHEKNQFLCSWPLRYAYNKSSLI